MMYCCDVANAMGMRYLTKKKQRGQWRMCCGIVCFCSPFLMHLLVPVTRLLLRGAVDCACANIRHNMRMQTPVGCDV